VSFASSALFHALVTASLEQGFVPGILRADDACIALAVHGPHGARLGLVMVTSELSAGRTADLEARLRWRLDVIHQAALLAAGQDMLSKAAGGQQADSIRRLLTERLAPVVSQLMASEEGKEDDEGQDAKSLLPRAPRLGLRVHGACLEWLALGCSGTAEMVLEELSSAAFSSEFCPKSAANPGQRKAVLSWRGRILAATPAWRRLSPVDRGLLLAMADGVGPACFGQARSLALEELSELWPRKDATPGEPKSDQARPHRMLSVRLFPQDEAPAAFSVTEREEASLVLSVLDESSQGSGSTQRLLEAAASSSSLKALWKRLLTRAHSVAGQLLGSEAGWLRAAVLLDSRTGDIVSLPTPWQVDLRLGSVSQAAVSLRRLLYWMHALPPLDASRLQQFVCTEDHLVAAARRDDGIVCWALVDRRKKSMKAVSSESQEVAEPVLQAIQRLLKRLPRAGDLWSAFGALETPEKQIPD